jgi:outer membrane lipoprotein SlyB
LTVERLALKTLLNAPGTTPGSITQAAEKRSPTMNRLCTFGGAAVGGYAGWFFGQPYGLGVAFVLSAVGSLVGVYAGWKLAQRLG